MSLLNKLTVNGFKSIETCELELQRLNVVIGPNGAGKSNLIGVFRFLNSVLSKQLQLYVGEHGGPDRLLHHGEKTTPKMSFRFDFGSNAYSFCLKPAVGDTMVFDWETIELLAKHEFDKWCAATVKTLEVHRLGARTPLLPAPDRITRHPGDLVSHELVYVKRRIQAVLSQQFSLRAMPEHT